METQFQISKRKLLQYKIKWKLNSRSHKGSSCNTKSNGNSIPDLTKEAPAILNQMKTQFQISKGSSSNTKSNDQGSFKPETAFAPGLEGVSQRIQAALESMLVFRALTRSSFPNARHSFIYVSWLGLLPCSPVSLRTMRERERERQGVRENM